MKNSERVLPSDRHIDVISVSSNPSEAGGGITSFVLSLTDICNIKCSYCFEDKAPDRAMRNPGFVRILDEIVLRASQLREGSINIAFYGGEPLVEYQSIKNIVKHIISQVSPDRVKFRIATNGLLITDEVLKFLVEHSFAIQISLDGPPEVMDIHRLDFKGNGVAHRMKWLLGQVRSLPDAIARMTLTPMNVAVFAESLKYLIDIGFDCPERSIKFDFDLTADWSEEALDGVRCGFELASDALVEHYASGGCAVVDPLNRIFQNERPTESKCGKGGYCGAGVSTIHVSPQLTVYTCNRLTHSHDGSHRGLAMSQGKISLERREDILKAIHPGIKRKSECRSCMARHYCEQTCPARIHSSSGRFDQISEPHCKTIRMTHKLGRTVRAKIMLGHAETWTRFRKLYRLDVIGVGSGFSGL